MQKYNKFWIALGAALTVTGSALADGSINGNEPLQIITALLGAAGVFLARNKAS